MYDHIADFLSELEDRGDLCRIAADVDPVFEIAEITSRICTKQGEAPALLFEKVKGHTMPVVTNLLGHRKRMGKALRGDHFDQVAERLSSLWLPDIPEDWVDTLKRVPKLSHLSGLSPRQIKTAICQQVVKMGSDVNLNELPLLQSWPEETAASLHQCLVVTADAQTQKRYCTLHNVMRLDPRSLALSWTQQDPLHQIYQQYQSLNQQMPLAIVVGGDPVVHFAAQFPLPGLADAFVLAGFLGEKQVELVKCRSLNLLVLAHAEIIIEGYIDTQQEPTAELSLGVSSGFYLAETSGYQLHTSAVTSRSNPVMVTRVAGPPPSEDLWYGRANERLMLPWIKQYIPELQDLHLPAAGLCRNIVFASINKTYPMQARKVMQALWSLDPLRSAKWIVVVDSEMNVQDEQEIWYALSSQAHPGRDVLFCEGPTHPEDHAAPIRGVGHKMGIDATRKFPEENHPRNWPNALKSTSAVKDLVTRRWNEYGLPGSRE